METEAKIQAGRCEECGDVIEDAPPFSDLCSQCRSKSLRELGLGFQLERLWTRVSPLLSRLPPLTLFVVGLNLAIYFLIAFGQGFGWQDVLQRHLALNTATLARGELWRLVTYAFVQVRLSHLLSNLVLLFVLGWFVEGVLEPSKFALVLLITAVSGAAVEILIRTDRRFVLIGSSAMVFGLIGTLLSFYILGRVPLSNKGHSWRLVVLFGLLLFSLVGDWLITHRPNLPHVGGLLVGLFFGAVVSLKPIGQANEKADCRRSQAITLLDRGEVVLQCDPCPITLTVTVERLMRCRSGDAGKTDEMQAP